MINAPATGAVRRVLVAEGMNVKAGTPIIEIAVRNETRSSVPSAGESAETRAVRRLQATSTDIEAARAEVLRHEAEVQLFMINHQLKGGSTDEHLKKLARVSTHNAVCGYRCHG